MINFSFQDVLESIKVFWIIIKSLWWIWVIVLIIGLFPVIINWFFKWLEGRRLKKWLEEHKKLEDWKKLDGREFEKVVFTIYRNLGYKAKRRRDHGIDIIAIKDGKRIFIQCKQMDKVKPDHVRAFWGSIEGKIKKRKGEKGFFVTTGEFTEQSRGFVKDKPIELIDGLKLEKLANL